MKRIRRNIFAHFETISDDPWKFVLWFITSVVLALSSVWIPTLVGWFLVGENWFPKLMEGNPLIIFSIVFISSSVLTGFNIIGAGSTRAAMAIRGITLVITIIYLIFLSTLVPAKLLKDISIPPLRQGFLLLISILLGVYVYGFREIKWEKSLDEAREEQDRKIEKVAEKAKNLDNDGTEVKL